MKLYLYSNNKKSLFGWDSPVNWKNSFFENVRKNCSVIYDFGLGGLALLCDEATITFFKEVVQKQKQANNQRALQLSSFFNEKNLGQIVFIFDHDNITDWVRFASIQFLESGESQSSIQRFFDNRIMQYNDVSTKYEYRAYGFDNITVYVGEPDKGKRVCRFCNATGIENFTGDLAHAIPDSLGNKLLFCNEECKTCNHTLNTIENDLVSLMRVRQAIFKIKRKKKSSAPEIYGQDFVIRPDKNGDPNLYLMAEHMPTNWKELRQFLVRLNLKYETVDQDIYRAFAKIVIDLIPNEYLNEFSETIAWIKSEGRFIPDSLPSIQFALLQNGIFYEQPIVELFLYNKGDAKEPFCLCYLRIYDMVYRFIVPFATSDKGNFRKDSELDEYWRNLTSNIPLKWESQSLINWWESAPWCEMDIDIDNPHIHILPSTDSIFNGCELPSTPENVEYPKFDKTKIQILRTHRIAFKDFSKKHIVTEQEKKDFNLTFLQPILRINLKDEVIRLFFKLDAGTHNHHAKYFSIDLCMDLTSPDFNQQVDFRDEWIGINRDFSTAIIDAAFIEASRQLKNKLQYSQFQQYPMLMNFVGNEQFYSNLMYEVYGREGICRFPHDFFHGNLPDEKRYFYLTRYGSQTYETIYPNRSEKHNNDIVGKRPSTE